MSTEEYIALVYKNLKGDLTSREFKQLNDLTAKNMAMSQLRLEIEDAWDISGEEPQIITRKDTEALISKLKNQDVESASKPSQTKSYNLRRIIGNVAALLIFAFGAIWLMRDQVTVYDAAGQYTLADESIIELREGSRVEVSSFDESSRNVKLVGEAFFVVARDTKRPFVVTTKDTRTEVLGTSFLIKESYGKTYIDLKTGEVSFESLHAPSKSILTPGMQAVCDQRVVNITEQYSNLSGWKEGVYTYKDTKLSVILDEFKIIFDANIEVVDMTLYDCTLSAILTGDNIDDVLTQIANQLEMEVVSDDGKWRLSGGKCK